MKIYQILTSGFGEEDFLRIVHVVQNAPIHESHVYSRIKLSQTIFQKVT